MRPEKYEINAEDRQAFGKRSSRRLRRTGMLPAVVYGDKKDNHSIVINHADLWLQLENEGFYSHVLSLNVANKTQRVIVKDMQRHPYKKQVLHLDLQRISETEEIAVHVPIHYLNETTCIGVKQNGGSINHIMTELEVSCLPKNLPEFIEVDVEGMDIGDALHLSDLPLPNGVTLHALKHGGDASQPVVSVYMPRGEVVEDAAPVAPVTESTTASTEGEGAEEKPQQAQNKEKGKK